MAIQMSLPQVDATIEELNRQIAFMNELVDADGEYYHAVPAGTLYDTFAELRTKIINKRNAYVAARNSFMETAIIEVTLPE